MAAVAKVSKGQTNMSYKGDVQTLTQQSKRLWMWKKSVMA